MDCAESRFQLKINLTHHLGTTSVLYLHRPLFSILLFSIFLPIITLIVIAQLTYYKFKFNFIHSHYISKNVLQNQKSCHFLQARIIRCCQFLLLLCFKFLLKVKFAAGLIALNNTRSLFLGCDCSCSSLLHFHLDYLFVTHTYE